MDMKASLLVTGINAPNSDYYCQFCIQHKNVIADFQSIIILLI